jgi:hypothetical protein
MKKLIYTFMIILFPVCMYSQPTVSGRFSLVTNNGTNYVVKVQISTNTGTDALGDATIPFTFNSSDLTYVGTTFQNFTDGDYYTATATNSPSNRISLNITFNTGSGTIVSNTFMDVATITFITQNPAGSSNLTFAAPMEFFSTSFTTQWINGTFTNLNTNPLPVELTSFAVCTVGQTKVKLNWRTATEVNNYGFEVERTINIEQGKWEKIGFVQGNGNSNSPKEYLFMDSNPVGGDKFYYRLKQIDNDGEFVYTAQINITIVPAQFELSQSYPNPFNPKTNINFSLPKQTQLKIILYNMLGELVKIINEGLYELGYHKVTLEANDIPSGTYIYRLESNDFTQSKKLILLK